MTVTQIALSASYRKGNRNSGTHPDRNKQCNRLDCTNKWDRRGSFGYDRICNECYRKLKGEA